MDASDWEMTMLRSFQFITCTRWTEKRKKREIEECFKMRFAPGRFHDLLEVHET